MLKDLEKICERLSEITTVRSADRDMAERWINVPLSIPPWEVWTLLCLVRHRTRQQFVADMIRFRLDADLDALATAGAFAHPTCPQQGVMPGMLDWEYYFHGRGCCLTHRATGEAIDVDFYDSTADWFDAFFFVQYLQSLKSPTFVEQQVVRLHPSYETAVLAIDRLWDMELLERFEDDGAFRLAFDHEELASLLDKIESSWEDPKTQLLVASAMSDWLLLENMSLDDALQSTVTAKADFSRRERQSYLVKLFNSGNQEAEALEALHDLGSSLLDEVLVKALHGPPSGAMNAALEVIEKMNDKRWCSEVKVLSNRIDPNEDIPAPTAWLNCCKILLKNGLRHDIRKQLTGIRSHILAEVALLALEYIPDMAVDLFRKALRSSIPLNRITAAAALAVMDQPWCRRELASVLDESNDQLMTAECRSALLETHSEEHHRRVHHWEELNPHEPEQGPFIYLDEMSLQHSDERIRWEMQNLHDRVMQLRNALPPDGKK